MKIMNYPRISFYIIFLISLLLSVVQVQSQSSVKVDNDTHEIVWPTDFLDANWNTYANEWFGVDSADAGISLLELDNGSKQIIPAEIRFGDDITGSRIYSSTGSNIIMDTTSQAGAITIADSGDVTLSDGIMGTTFNGSTSILSLKDSVGAVKGLVNTDGQMVLGNGTVSSSYQLTINPTDVVNGLRINAAGSGITFLLANSAAAAIYRIQSSGGAFWDMQANTDNTLAFERSDVAVLTLSNVSASYAIPIYALAGTDAAPAYSFLSDPDTGFYRSDTNEIAISLGGNVDSWFTGTGFSTNNLAAVSIQKDGVPVGTRAVVQTEITADGATYTPAGADVEIAFISGDNADPSARTITSIAAGTVLGQEIIFLEDPAGANPASIDHGLGETILTADGYRRYIWNGTDWLMLERRDPA